MQYTAAIFDLDGTLLDTLETLAYYGNTALEKVGLAPYEKNEYRYMIGNGAKKLIQRMLAGRGADELFEKAYELYITAYNSDTLFKTEMYTGITALLTALKEKGIKLAVLSNKPNESTVPIIKSFFGEDVFSDIRGAVEGVPLKPDPAAALDIAEKLGCAPAECLYVGDTGVDMETGRRAGFYTVGVLWGFRDRDELIQGGADRIAETPMEIVQYLQEVENA